jgi:bifunctional DNase/RNase
MVEMEVVGVAPEPNSNKPLVWLKDKDQKVFLPISIGNFEATAIYMELYDEPPPRPICYDLVKSVLGEVDVKVVRIVINDLKDDTFYAQIALRRGDRVLNIDSRPSDAIALALRVHSPIFAADSVLVEAGLEVDGDEDAPKMWEDVPDELSGLPAELDDPEPVFVKEPVRLTDALKERLKEAVSKEEYEEAAKLRDELGGLEGRSNS